MLFVQWRTLKECINNILNQLSRLIIWFFDFLNQAYLNMHAETEVTNFVICIEKNCDTL